ncbi:hypothetical protein AB9K34_12275, partial [Sedimentitalea sp. XS_ASV28]|uniref:hypothetical protein n=1 Tax=Sedimentitalea sp. XS_ASV28 TaxID=3241296 RepID=UPI003511A362
MLVYTAMQQLLEWDRSGPSPHRRMRQNSSVSVTGGIDRFLPMDSGRGFLSSERTKRNFGTFDLRLASAHACSAPYRSGRSGRT